MNGEKKKREKVQKELRSGTQKGGKFGLGLVASQKTCGVYAKK
jgi:hypothetical protein